MFKIRMEISDSALFLSKRKKEREVSGKREGDIMNARMLLYEVMFFFS